MSEDKGGMEKPDGKPPEVENSGESQDAQEDAKDKAPEKKAGDEAGGDDKWKQLMKSLSFFHGYEEAQFNELLQSRKVKKYKEFEYIVKENEPGLNFYIILKGTAQVIKKDVFNMKTTIGTLNPGDSFGEMSFLLGEGRTASIRAINPCFAFEIDSKLINELSKDTQICVYRSFSTMLAKRLNSITKI